MHKVLACHILLCSTQETITDRLWFHGTRSEDRAKQIQKQGIYPQDVSLHNIMSPVAGKIYLANIEYALLYAFGSAIVPGQKYNARVKQEIDRTGRYGFVFIVPGSLLQEVNPDEDKVGEWFCMHSKPKYAKPIPENDFIYAGNDKKEQIVWNFINSKITEQERKKVCAQDWAWMAVCGKRAVERMPDWMKIHLIRWGNSLAHTGPVKPTECWRIDKSECNKYKSDGSDFFKTASKV